MATTVRQMLRAGGDVYSVTPETTVFDALKLMADRDVGAVVVLSGRELAGIFTERDYARKVILLGKTSRELAVRDVMSPHVITIDPCWTVERCMVLMDERHIRHLPVVEGDKVVGIVSIRAVVGAVVAEQKYTITHLENYISSGS